MGGGGPHHPIILQRMFVHATEVGQKEVEMLICQGHWHGLPRLNPGADVPAIQLVGYQTSQEIQDLYHEVYLLKRLPVPLPCRPKWMEEAIKDIPSSLREPPVKARRYCHVGGGPKGGLPHLLCGPAAKLDPTLRALRPKGGTAHVMGPSGS